MVFVFKGPTPEDSLIYIPTDDDDDCDDSMKAELVYIPSSDEEDQMLASDDEDDDCHSNDSMGAEVVYVSSDDDSDENAGMCESLLFRLLHLSVICLSRVRSRKGQRARI